MYKLQSSVRFENKEWYNANSKNMYYSLFTKDTRLSYRFFQRPNFSDSLDVTDDWYFLIEDYIIKKNDSN